MPQETGQSGFSSFAGWSFSQKTLRDSLVFLAMSHMQPMVLEYESQHLP